MKMNMKNTLPCKYFRLDHVRQSGTTITVKMTLVLAGTNIPLGEESWDVGEDFYAPADPSCTKLPALCSPPYLLEDVLYSLACNPTHPLYISCNDQGYL